MKTSAHLKGSIVPIATLLVIMLTRSQLAQATVLTFDVTGLTDGVLLPQAYGDRVTSTLEGNFSYGSDYGFTPNVTASYVGFGGQQDLNWWSTSYCDLLNVIEYEPDGANGYQVVLTADAGYTIQLNGFDLGNYGGEVVLPGITVADQNSQIIWSQTQGLVPASGQQHLDFDFGQPLVGTTLTITVDTTGMGGNSDNMGLDNIAFGQTPEPVSVMMILAGSVGLLSKRRKSPEGSH